MVSKKIAEKARNKKLIAILNELELSSVELAEILDTSRQNINKAYQEDDLRPVFLRPLKEHFPNLSSEWLLTGEGEMFATNIKEDETVSQKIKSLEDTIQKQQKEIDRLNSVIDLMLERAKAG